jgi:hypothetical protein
VRSAARATVIGRKVVMDTDTYTFVGVMPRDFQPPGETGARRRGHVERVRLRRGAVYRARRSVSRTSYPA